MAKVTIELEASEMFFLIGGLKQLKNSWKVEPLEELGATETMIENARFITENCDRLIAELRSAEDKAWAKLQQSPPETNNGFWEISDIEEWKP